MRRLAPLLPALLLLIAYWGTWNFDYLSYDDPEYVSANPVVQNGLSWDGVRWALTTGHAANWHPLTWISHMLDRSLFGPGPAGPHAMNLLLHLAGCFALWVALRALSLPLPAVLLASCIYAAHPTRLESVVWISERKDVLSALFGWLSLWLHLRFVHERRTRDRIASVLALTLGLLAKPMLVSWPLLLLVVDRFVLRREESGPALLREKWPHFAVAALAAAATLAAQASGGAMRTAASIGLLDRAANALVALLRYPFALLWPERLSFFYPHPALLPSQGGHPALLVLLAGCGVLLIVASCLRARRSLWTAGWLLYLVTVLPVLGLVQVGPQAWADRYLAIPGVGLSLAVYALIARTATRRGSQLAIVSVLALLSTARTRAQLAYWTDDAALYGRAIEVTDRNWLAHGNLGQMWSTRGRPDLAYEQYRLAVQAKPDDAISLYNLGTSLLEMGHLQEAEQSLRSAIDADPLHVMAHNNLAQCLARQGRYAEALPLQERAVELDPNDIELALNLADLERRTGAVQRAATRLEQIAREEPTLARPHDLLARVFFESDPERAVAHAERAVELDHANDPRLLETLAQCQWQAGRFDAARATAARALPLAEAARQNDRVARLRAILEDPH